MLSIILAALLAAPLLVSASTVGAVPQARGGEGEARQAARRSKAAQGGEAPGGDEVEARGGEGPLGAAQARRQGPGQRRHGEPRDGRSHRGGRPGQTVEVRATALRSGQTCVFRLFYDDKKGPGDPRRRAGREEAVHGQRDDPVPPRCRGRRLRGGGLQQDRQRRGNGSARQAFTLN